MEGLSGMQHFVEIGNSWIDFRSVRKVRLSGRRGRVFIVGICWAGVTGEDLFECSETEWGDIMSAMGRVRGFDGYADALAATEGKES